MLIRQFAYSGVLLLCNVLGFDIGYTRHNELHSQAERVDLCTLYKFTFSVLPSQWPITNTQVDVFPEAIVNENLYLVFSLISAWEGFCYLENSVCNNQIAVWVGVELSGIESWFQWFIKSFFFFINDRSLLFVFSTSRLLSLVEVFKALEGSLKRNLPHLSAKVWLLQHKLHNTISHITRTMIFSCKTWTKAKPFSK